MRISWLRRGVESGRPGLTLIFAGCGPRAVSREPEVRGWRVCLGTDVRVMVLKGRYFDGVLFVIFCEWGQQGGDYGFGLGGGLG